VGLVYWLSSGYGHDSYSKPSWDVVVNPDGTYSTRPVVPRGQLPIGQLNVDLSIKSDLIGVSVKPIVTFTPTTPGTAVPQEAIDEMAGAMVRDHASRFDTRREVFSAEEISSLTSRPRFFVLWESLSIYVTCLLAIGAVVYYLVFLRERAKWRRYIREAIAARQCPYCEYSLEGLMIEVCPECGNSVAQEPPQKPRQQSASGTG
jgi:hypothetical protein